MKNIILLIIAIAFFSCSGQKSQLPNDFDFGEIKNGVYSNDYFKMKIPFNSDWNVQNKQQMNDIVELGHDIITESSEDLKTIVEVARVNTAYLFTVFKHELGAAVDYNPSFVVVAENTKKFPGIKTGNDYLFHAKKLLEQVKIKYSFEKEITKRTIGDSTFYILESKVKFMGTIIIQEYISTVKNGFSLSFILSYVNNVDRDELYKIIDNIIIN